jgi:antitoxin component of RelBE/YafQ-DinJ toxin-antitoxin module
VKEFSYKEYTEEESRLYEQTLQKILQGLKEGMTFQAACSIAQLDDAVLKGFVEDDALKIMIAEMHYQQGLMLEQVAEKLGMPVDTLMRANDEMLQDVEMTSVEFYQSQHPGSHSGTA